MRTVIGLFETFRDADRAYSKILDAGITADDISLITKEETAKSYLSSGKNSQTEQDIVQEERVTTGASAGAVAGTLMGLLAGVSAITIPGIGPVITAGTIASMLASTGIGAGIGVASGGLVGALSGADLDEEEILAYQSGIEEGGILLTVSAEEDRAADIEDIMMEAGALQIEDDLDEDDE
ncbi:MAG: hypothetical protein M3Q81_02445 [bacterium]|nr:hypothetical protein [bacterium]